MTEETARRIPLRTQLAIYGSGLFADGATTVVIPLWALYLHPSALVFGIVIGARSLLPFLLSIHGGVLMDRLGARQVMLFFATIGLVTPVLFPLLPWIWVAGILNLVIGLTSTMNWVGAQTVVGQLIRGDPSLTWRVTFCNRLGHLVSPVVAGFMFIVLFGPDGWLGRWFEAGGVRIVFAVPGMVLATLFVTLPFVARQVVPVLREFGLEQEEAARTLGANEWQTFWRVTIPSVRWGLAYGVTLTVARALGEFGAVLVVSGSIIGKTQTATLLIHQEFTDFHYAGAFTASLVLAVVSFCLLVAMELIKKRVQARAA